MVATSHLVVGVCHKRGKTHKCTISSGPVKAYRSSTQTCCHACHSNLAEQAKAVASCMTRLCQQQQLRNQQQCCKVHRSSNTGPASVSWHCHVMHAVQAGPSTWIITPRKPPGCVQGSKGTKCRRPPHPLPLDRRHRHAAATDSADTLQYSVLSFAVPFLLHVVTCT